MHIDGIINILKPKGISSFRVVNEIKNISGIEKAGHTGTLDPNASGVLLICLGNATKISRFIMDFKKCYQGEMILGIETDSQDSEGKVIKKINVDDKINRDMVIKVFKKYSGTIKQAPPMFSAAYHKGKRLYKLARKGLEVERETKKITIFKMSLLEFIPSENPIVRFEVICSKGTYVRTLCSDIGKDLHCGAYMSELIRTKVGKYDISDSITIEKLNYNKNLLQKKLINIDMILDHFGEIKLKRGIEKKVLHGGFVYNDEIQNYKISDKNNFRNMVKVKDEKGKLLSIAERVVDENYKFMYKPLRVFCQHK